MIAASACSFFPSKTSTTTKAGDAAFRVIHLVLNSVNAFGVSSDSILLSKKAITPVETINPNQKPTPITEIGYTRLTILYYKSGVLKQDVFDLLTGKTGIGILLKGGTTFESFTNHDVFIDATDTTEITIVPLENITVAVRVAANQGWQDTGMFLERGRQFSVTYVSGLWTIQQGVVATSDAAGIPPNPPSYLYCNCGEPVPGFSTQAMIGRVGDGSGHAPLQIGDAFAGISYDNDFLQLRINDADAQLGDNFGVITVNVTVMNG
jgi:hypothetical protein